MRRTTMKISKVASVLALFAALLVPRLVLAQTDPGVQGGPARAGSPLASVNSSDGTLQFFQNGLTRFQDIESVKNSPTGNNGLGPRFNFVSCSGCHLQPAVGGTGPATNPQFQVIANGLVSGSTNTIPSFITANGPTREARFPFFFDQFGNPNPNAPNGGVEDLFTVSGRSDAGSCSLQQPSFAQAQATNNLIFRIPTPTFGTGLIENVDDSTLLNNQAANANNNLASAGPSITTVMTAPSAALAGRRRTSRWSCLLARPTTWKWVLPMRFSRKIVLFRERTCTQGSQRAV